MKNLLIRALTGTIFVALIVGSICSHPLAFLFVFSLITASLLWEFYGLVEPFSKYPARRFVYSLGGLYLFCATFLFAHDLTGNIIFLPYLFFLMATMIAELYLKNKNPIDNWSLTFLGQFYLAGSFSLLNFISATPNHPGEISYVYLHILALFIFVWINDTGAYLIGSLFGKHRLFERISPKKSWEGFWGGFIAAVASSQIFAAFDSTISWYNWIGFSVVIVLFATWGDLIESLFKRTLEVKDSGKVLPGHGGMLDRFDSILLAIPAAYIYFKLFIA